ncbi:MAG: VOC family protein [Erysipelothrix sp.]|nr:VOC family protein [Erysipelothrix sp.]
MVKFGYTILYVLNVAKSVGFYEKSFGFKRKFITPENDYGEIETGQTTIAFASVELAKSNLRNGFIESRLDQKPFATELGFITDNVDKIINLAKQHGATVIEEPILKPWGQTVAYIRDIDGFLIELCTPMNK